jgi:hypothetical protein
MRTLRAGPVTGTHQEFAVLTALVTMEFVEWHGGKIAGAQKFSIVLRPVRVAAGIRPDVVGGILPPGPGVDRPATLGGFMRLEFACGCSAGLEARLHGRQEACHHHDKRLRARHAALRCEQTRAPAPQPERATCYPFKSSSRPPPPPNSRGCPRISNCKSSAISGACRSR